MSLASITLGQQPQTRAALFVDFDNVYIGLQKLDPVAAELFATDPGPWTDAMASGDGDSPGTRRFLVRNCYLNPSVFSKYRAYWTRAGYRVIDCPSLTQQGKSSTDINLVLDAVDVLAEPVRIEEFFIASADADFTSLIQRFRAADRFTTVIVAGAVAGAYRSTADRIVESDAFVSMLHGQVGQPPKGTKALLEVAAPSSSTPSPAIDVNRPQTKAGAGATGAAAVVLDFVTSAPGLVTTAILAKRAQVAEPALAGDWAGTGSFTAWLAQFEGRVGYSTKPPPGWAWDAERFSAEDLPKEVDGRPTIEQQVTRVTDIPPLSTAQFRQLFLSLESRLNSAPFNRNETAKQVRDDCTDAGVQVSRSAINFVITGLLYAGVALTSDVTAKRLATGWAKNVEALCGGARMEFDESEKDDLRMWVSGGLATSEDRSET
jgi:hypothetical protein